MPSARRLRSLLIALAAIGGLVVPTAQARTDADEVQTIWRLLDYVAVDYGGAIANGEVTSPVEYAEMTEFSATVRKGIEALPASPARARLVGEAGQLQMAIASKVDPGKVAGQARGLAADLLAAYRVLVNIRNRPMAVNLGGEFGNTRFYAISEASAPRGNRAFLARQASDVLYLFRFGDQIAIAMQRTQHTSNRRECGPRIVAARLLWLLLLIGYDDVRQRRATSIACAT